MKNLFLGLIMLAGTASFANVSTNEIKSNETKTELVLTSTVSSEVTYTNYDDDCKWYMITTIKTKNLVIWGIWIGSTIETTTEIKCI